MRLGKRKLLKSKESDLTLNCYKDLGIRKVLSRSVSQLPYGKALYTYEGKEPGDLKFNKGDIIILRRKVDENWYHGELNGNHGFFPASYIQCIKPLPQAPPQGKALYDFEIKDKDQDKDCLTFTKDEILTVIRRVDDNWAEGMLGDKIGIFPILYVENSYFRVNAIHFLCADLWFQLFPLLPVLLVVPSRQILGTRSVLGPVLFKTFVCDMESRIKFTLSKFAGDTKLCGVVNTLKGKDGIQRVLDRPESALFFTVVMNASNIRISIAPPDFFSKIVLGCYD
ncbi:hypothetical protein TURU_049054 [Turdus rufiventris]|nr:hypothetical protein TURU_049054 [Turdus rufiventris]